MHQSDGLEDARYLPRWRIGEVTGAVVAVDVIRAFTTAAYAFAAGAREIWLVGEIDDALECKRRQAGVLAMGENHGRKPDGFDFSNSPVQISQVDLAGRTIVQRTSAGTRGVVASGAHADQARRHIGRRAWCA